MLNRQQFTFRLSSGTDQAIERLRIAANHRRISRSAVIERAVVELCRYHNMPEPLDIQDPREPVAVDPDGAEMTVDAI